MNSSQLLLSAPLFALCLLGYSAFTPGGAEPEQKTIVKDAAQKKQLLGKHMLSLQWIMFEKGKYGTATVQEKNGVLLLKGEQVGTGKSTDYLKVDGKITEVDAKSFKFNGKIATKVSHINNGEECLRNGDMTFLAKGQRKYWRLQEMDNPCSTVTDYVDVYFR